MKTFRVAFVQGRPAFGRTEANLEKGLALAATIHADLVVLPELWSTGYVFSSHAEVAALAEDARTGATARALVWAARREKRHYVAGFAEVARGRYYNSAMLVGPAGVKAVYRKLHLFEREQEWFERGNLPLEVQRVGPARIGMLICYDWRFPEASRVLALRGADVIAHPSNLVYPNAQQAMLTRALENRIYVVTANRTGTEKRPGGTCRSPAGARSRGPTDARSCARRRWPRPPPRGTWTSRSFVTSASLASPPCSRTAGRSTTVRSRARADSPIRRSARRPAGEMK